MVTAHMGEHNCRSTPSRRNPLNPTALTMGSFLDVVPFLRTRIDLFLVKHRGTQKVASDIHGVVGLCFIPFILWPRLPRGTAGRARHRTRLLLVLLQASAEES